MQPLSPKFKSLVKKNRKVSRRRATTDVKDAAMENDILNDRMSQELFGEHESEEHYCEEGKHDLAAEDEGHDEDEHVTGKFDPTAEPKVMPGKRIKRRRLGSASINDNSPPQGPQPPSMHRVGPPVGVGSSDPDIGPSDEEWNTKLNSLYDGPDPEWIERTGPNGRDCSGYKLLVGDLPESVRARDIVGWLRDSDTISDAVKESLPLLPGPWTEQQGPCCSFYCFLSMF